MRRTFVRSLPAASLGFAVAAVAAGCTPGGPPPVPAGCEPPSVESVDIGTLGGRSAVGRDIDDQGRVVGGSDTGSGWHAFRWEAGTMTDLTPGSPHASEAVATNEAGVVLVEVTPYREGRDLFLWEDGALRPVAGGRPGDPSVGGLDVNDAGDVLLHRDPGGWALWRDGAESPVIPPAGADITLPRLLESGHVVGSLSVPGEPRREFVWQDGAMAVLPLPGAAPGDDPAVPGGGAVDLDVPVVTSVADGSPSGATAYLWEGDGWTALGSFIPTDVHEDGDRVVGVQWGPAPPGRAVLWQDGRLHRLDREADRTTEARAIGRGGDVIGPLRPLSGPDGSYLWSCGELVDLGPAGQAEGAVAVNAHGQVMSAVTDADGASRVLLSTP